MTKGEIATRVLLAFLQVVLVVLGALIQWFDFDRMLVVLAFWDLVAYTYVVILGFRAWRSIDGRPRLPRRFSRTARVFSAVLTFLTSAVGINAGATIALSKHTADSALVFALCIPAVLAAWAMLHYGFAELYAQLCQSLAPFQALEFPDDDPLTFMDYVYFSFTIGVSFAVSDVTAHGARIRRLIWMHSVVSFVYNTAIIGIVISLITQ